MDPYKEMYLKLFNSIEDIIAEFRKLQAETEEIFITAEDDKEE